MLQAIAARSAAAEPRPQGRSAVIYRRSHGTVAIVTPWNNPVYIPVGKTRTALLYGNTVVWKPAPAASALAIRLVQTFVEAGGPPGTLNLVLGGHTAAQHLIADPAIDAVSLTGSEEAGAVAQSLCAQRSIPLQAELGGNNAAIVWSDSDLSQTAHLIAEGAFGMAGQRCTANRRVVVESGCHAKFLELLAASTARLRWGDPIDDETQVGPLISTTAALRIAALIGRTTASGYPAIAPHREIARNDSCLEHETYFLPTIITCENPQAEIVQQETFGPIVVLQPARSWEHALELCNGVRQGLAAALFSQNAERRGEFLAQARAGLLKLDRSTSDAEVDLPFGGWKASGFGPAEHGDSDLEFYTRVQTVYQ